MNAEREYLQFIIEHALGQSDSDYDPEEIADLILEDDDYSIYKEAFVRSSAQNRLIRDVTEKFKVDEEEFLLERLEKEAEAKFKQLKPSMIEKFKKQLDEELSDLEEGYYDDSIDLDNEYEFSTALPIVHYAIQQVGVRLVTKGRVKALVTQGIQREVTNALNGDAVNSAYENIIADVKDSLFTEMRNDKNVIEGISKQIRDEIVGMVKKCIIDGCSDAEYKQIAEKVKSSLITDLREDELFIKSIADSFLDEVSSEILK